MASRGSYGGFGVSGWYFYGISRWDDFYYVDGAGFQF